MVSVIAPLMEARAAGAPVGVLDLALGADDHPAILWGGPDDGPSGLRLRLITCDDPRCRP